LPQRREPRLRFRIAFRAGQHEADPACVFGRLLRARRERPRSRHAAEQRHEFAALHSITSSAVASSIDFSFNQRP
jgi:hypothetical protein